MLAEASGNASERHQGYFQAMSKRQYLGNWHIAQSLESLSDSALAFPKAPNPTALRALRTPSRYWLHVNIVFVPTQLPLEPFPLHASDEETIPERWGTYDTQRPLQPDDSFMNGQSSSGPLDQCGPNVEFEFHGISFLRISQKRG